MKKERKKKRFTLHYLNVLYKITRKNLLEKRVFSLVIPWKMLLNKLAMKAIT